MAKDDIDYKLLFQAIKDLPEEQQQQEYYTLAKRANQRFRDIERKSHLKSGAIDKARDFLKTNYDRTTFKQSTKLSGFELTENLKALEKFYTSKTATAKGIQALEKQRVKAFEIKGYKIKDKDKFYQFLSSQQFKTLSKYADSEQVIQDFNRAIDDGFSLDEIMKGYDEFLNSDMTFEQVEERRNGKGLLH